jgi:hypothetical protein
MLTYTDPKVKQKGITTMFRKLMIWWFEWTLRDIRSEIQEIQDLDISDFNRWQVRALMADLNDLYREEREVKCKIAMLKGGF